MSVSEKRYIVGLTRSEVESVVDALRYSGTMQLSQFNTDLAAQIVLAVDGE